MLTFKEFLTVTELSDEEFNRLEEGLSDVPGFGWLKNIGNDAAKRKAAMAKIAAERQKLQKLKTARAKELDAALAAFGSGQKPGQMAKPMHAGTISHDDLDLALDSRDRKFNAKMDRYRDINTNLEMA